MTLSITIYENPSESDRDAILVPLRAYNYDTVQAQASLRALAELDPLVVVPGHLGPLRGPDLRAQLMRAADAG